MVAKKLPKITKILDDDNGTAINGKYENRDRFLYWKTHQLHLTKKWLKITFLYQIKQNFYSVAVNATAAVT